MSVGEAARFLEDPRGPQAAENNCALAGVQGHVLHPSIELVTRLMLHTIIRHHYERLK